MEEPPSADTPESESNEPDSFKYTFSTSVAGLLAQARATLWVSTYQAGKLAVFRSTDEGRGLSLLLRTFDKAMGLALDPNRLAIGTRHQIWNLRNEPALAPKMAPKGTWDACYLPRSSHVTGNVDIHEMAWSGDELWFVNTLYSCLATLSPDASFIPRWHPPFISELRKHDRCHLNGLAMVDGVPAYVTAFAETNSPSGWRQGNHKREGGVVIDVASGETITRGLSMPHSPRYHAGRLWVLDSGNGRLVTVDPRDGSRETVAEFQGYTRGLAFLGRFAFVGLSRIRETAIFGGIPIAEKWEERKCGVQIVDIITGQIVGAIDFKETVDEVFDVQILPGIVSPTIVGLEKDGIAKHCIIGTPVPYGMKSFDPEKPQPKRPGIGGLSTAEGMQQEVILNDLKSQIAREPGNPKLLNQLGNLLYREGRAPGAIRAFRQAVHVAADYAPAHRNLATLLAESGDYPVAIAHARKALALEPDHPVSLNNLGLALRGAEALEESREALEAAVRIDPDYTKAWLNLAQTRREQQDWAGAVDACEKARNLSPDSTEILLMLANGLRDLNRFDEAAAVYEHILEIDPDSIDARNDFGLARQQQGDFAAARELFESVLAIRPALNATRRNLALLTLMEGDFEKGWEQHEARLIEKPIRRPLPSSPPWDGQLFKQEDDESEKESDAKPSSTATRGSTTLLLHGEQGHGDALQFVRFAHLAREKSGADRVILACKERLVPLLSHVAGLDQVISSRHDLPRHTAHASLMSLPFLFGTGSELFADRVPYLTPRPDLIASLRDRKTDGVPWIDDAETRVVIAWQGDTRYVGDRSRSIPLAEFAPLSEIDGVRLVSVQMGPGSEQMADAGMPLLDLGDEIDVHTGAFEETAALVSQSALVITSDTSLAHLAGALGLPVWVALAKVPDWRWGIEGTTCPWYPSMKLYRQEKAGDWEAVFNAMAADLAKTMA